MVRYDVQMRAATMTPAYTGTQTAVRTWVTSAVVSAIPSRSAAMLIVLAIPSRAHANHVTQSGYRRRMTPASPSPVTRPSRAHISWIAAIKGNEKNAVHSVAYPKLAPATEYVEIPDGSSSAAPVIKPGPRLAKNRRNGWRCAGSPTFGRWSFGRRVVARTGAGLSTGSIGHKSVCGVG